MEGRKTFKGNFFLKENDISSKFIDATYLSGKKNKLINLQLLFPICFPGFRCNKSQYLLLVQTVPYSKLLCLVCLNGIGRTGYLPLLLISPPQTRT
ncbi:hypothetical protein GQ457_10G029930 [Hibiscus cannabinus]